MSAAHRSVNKTVHMHDFSAEVTEAFVLVVVLNVKEKTLTKMMCGYNGGPFRGSSFSVFPFKLVVTSISRQSFPEQYIL